MRFPHGAAKPLTGNDIDTPAPRQESDGAFGACAAADRLLRDYFSRGSLEGASDHEAVREDTLSRLFDEVEAAVFRAATVRAQSLSDIARKRSLQDLMRQHRDMLSDHLAVVGQSIDRDLRRLLASETRAHAEAVSQGGWLGWARQTWKARPVEAITTKPEPLSV